MRYFSLVICLFYMTCALASDIAVVTLAIGEAYRKTVSPGIENKRSYCLEHGYDFICGEESLDASRRPGWNKILILLKVMENPDYKWVFWSDADSLFMNFDFLLEDLIDEEFSVLITKDMFEINPGQFFVRNSEWGRKFLLDVYSHTESIHHIAVELAALAFEIRKSENQQFVKILPQKSMNSYAKEVIGFFPPSVLRTSMYEPGDFILHFSGEHRLDQLRYLFKEYSEKVLRNKNCALLECAL